MGQPFYFFPRRSSSREGARRGGGGGGWADLKSASRPSAPLSGVMSASSAPPVTGTPWLRMNFAEGFLMAVTRIGSGLFCFGVRWMVCVFWITSQHSAKNLSLCWRIRGKDQIWPRGGIVGPFSGRRLLLLLRTKVAPVCLGIQLRRDDTRYLVMGHEDHEERPD